MSRPARNILHLDPLPGGGWRLHGYLRGKHIRQRSRDFRALEEKKLALERQSAAISEPDDRQPRPRLTWLSYEQLRDAEAATTHAGGRRLVECVVAAARVLPPISGKSCGEALEDWLAVMAKRKRSPRTRENTTSRVKSFLAHARAKLLQDILPAMIEDWVYRDEHADYTRITEAQVLRAWLNFCVKRRWLLVSPFELDMKDLKATARTVEPARILSPEQCHALLRAAAAVSDGRMLPYVILATWCAMSPQEVIRTTRAKMKLSGPTPIIEVDTVKRRTAKYRVVTVPPNVLPLLRATVEKWPEKKVVKDGKTRKLVEAGDFTVPFCKVTWDRVRAAAGLLKRAAPTKRWRRGDHIESVWQHSILRHTGISYLNQSLAAKAQRGEFNDKSVIAEVCRQAGNTNDMAFRHYLHLPAEGAADAFYAPVAAAPPTP